MRDQSVKDEQAHSEHNFHEETLELLRIIESSPDADVRQQAILLLGKKAGTCRVLIELWRRFPWRATRIDIVRAMGVSINTAHDGSRGLEFLMRLGLMDSDLTMAREALHSLGRSQQMMAAEYLTSFVQSNDHPLRRDALIALNELNHVPLSHEIQAILADNSTPQSLLQACIFHLGSSLFFRQPEDLLLDLLGRHQDQAAIFNTLLIIIGRIGSKRSLKVLERLDIHHRIFSDQLRISAISSIQLAERLTIEDAIATLNTNPDGGLRMLRRFPSETIFEAFKLLYEEPPPEIECMVRMVCHARTNLEADIAFVKDHFGKIPCDTLVKLMHVYRYQNIAEPEAFLAKLPQSHQDSIDDVYLRLYDINFGLKCISILDSCDDATFYRKVNVIVAQIHMAGVRSKDRLALCQGLFRVASQSSDPNRYLRIVRAFGQVGFSESHVVQKFSESFKLPEVSASMFFAFGNMESIEANQKICKFLKRNGDKIERKSEIVSALRALADSGCSCDGTGFDRIPEVIIKHSMIDVLKIMGSVAVLPWRGHVLDCLKSTHLQIQLLAIVAARLNNTQEIWHHVLGYLDSSIQVLSVRALDSICRSKDYWAHIKLMDWMESKWSESWVVTKFCDAFEACPGKDYQVLIARFEKALSNKKGVLASAEIAEQCLSLVESLRESNLKSEGLSGSSLKEFPHALDAALANEVRGYQQFSLEVKSVLRNAELTLHNPDLFDEHVDKSTIVMEYTKSIDMLLQARLGVSAISSKSLLAMQNQLIQMDLDHQNLSTGQLLVKLQCDSFLTQDNFSRHKFDTLCNAIVSGKFAHIHHRMLDGLRAWGLMLILFGRSYSYNQKSIKPLLPIPSDHSITIGQVVADMNLLQEIRNRAVHRGTLLNLHQIREVRELSFKVLNTLTAMFHSTEVQKVAS